MTIAVVDWLHDWHRAGRPSTPERREWAEKVFHILAAEALRNNLPDEMRAEHDAERPAISASSYKSCARQLWYANRGYAKEPVGPDAPRKWAVGLLHEAAFVAETITSGLNVLAPGPDGRQHVAEYEVGGETYKGHADLMLVKGLELNATHDEIAAAARGGAPKQVVEVKALNPYTASEFEKNGVDNRWGYLSQGTTYAYAEGLDEFTFIVVNKLQGRTVQIDHKVDPMMVEEIKSAILVAEDFSTDTPPARPVWATTIERPILRQRELKAKRCSYCPFATTICWPGLEKIILKGGPVYRGPLDMK